MVLQSCLLQVLVILALVLWQEYNSLCKKKNSRFIVYSSVEL